MGSGSHTTIRGMQVDDALTDDSMAAAGSPIRWPVVR